MAIRLPTPGQDYDPGWALELVRALEQEAVAASAPPTPRYTVSGYTETRSLDASSATTADLANFVCTLAADLKAAGKIG